MNDTPSIRAHHRGQDGEAVGKIFRGLWQDAAFRPRHSEECQKHAARSFQCDRCAAIVFLW